MLSGPVCLPMLRHQLYLSSLALFCAASPLLAQTWGDGPAPRQVAAPASDIESGLLRLPEPAAGAVRSRAALFELEWTADGAGGWRSEAALPVAPGPLALALQAHGAGGMEIELAVRGRRLLHGRGGAVRSDQVLSPEAGGEEVQRWDVGLRRGGEARVTVRFAAAPEPPASSSWPLTTMMLAAGTKPKRARASSDSNSATSELLLSSAPRPHTAPSATTPANGA